MADLAWCHSCDGEFVASVQECPDCGVPLQAEPPERSGGREVDDVASLDITAMTAEELELLVLLLRQREVEYEVDRRSNALLVGSRHAALAEDALTEVALRTDEAAAEPSEPEETSVRSRLRQLMNWTDRWGRPN